MTGKFKKALSVLIAVCMSLVVLPVTASAASMVSTSVSVSAKTVQVGSDIDVTISLEGIPYTGRVIPNDAVLVIDRSGSMSGNENAMKVAAKSFLDDLDLSYHSVGIVAYASGTQSTPLSQDREALEQYIDGIPSADGSTAMDQGINEAVKLLQKKRKDTTGAIVLMTDGQPDNAATAKAAATAAKNAGYVFYTVALTPGGNENSSANKFLKELATSETDHYSVFAVDKLNAVYRSVAAKIGACNAKDVVVQQTVQSGFEYVAGSGDNSIPKPTVSGNKLRWDFQQLSKGVSTVSFKLRANDVTPGSYKTLVGNVTYTDYDNKSQVISLNGPTVEIEGLPKVTGVTAVPGDRQVTVSWDEVSGAEEYRVCVFLDGTLKSYKIAKDATSAVVTGLQNGTEYGFWVQAYINSGYDAEPDLNGLVYATPKAAPKVEPPTPTGLTATPGNRSVALTWDAVQDAEEYRVCVFLNGTIQVYKSTSATSLNVTGLTNGKKYGFWVQAMVDGKYSCSPDKDNLVYATPKAPAPVVPATPTGLAATPGNKTVDLTWDAVQGAEEYRICVFLNGTIQKYNSTTATNFTVTALKNGKTYGFWVQAKVDGKYSSNPDKNNLVYAKPTAPDTRPATPSNVKAVSGDKSVTVSWDAVPNAESYRICVFKDGVIMKYNNVDGNSTSTVVTSLKNGVKYGFWVQSYFKQYSAEPDKANLIMATPKAVDDRPATPANQAVVAGDRSLTVTWSPVAGVTKYTVTVFLNGKAQRVATVAAGTTTATVANLQNGKKYGVWVQSYTTKYSVDPDMNNLLYAVPAAANVNNPTTPANITATPGSKSVTVTWDTVAGATEYRVNIIQNGKVVRYVNTDASATSAVVKNLQAGVEYRFWVQSYIHGYSEEPIIAQAVVAVPLA